MKKITYLLLASAVAVGAMSSCAKTNKRKMSNSWNVDERNWTITNIDSDGDRSTQEIEASGSTIKRTETYQQSGQPSVSSETTGQLHNAEYTIEKDGTWSSEFEFTFVDEGETGGFEYETTTKTTVVTTGEWDMLNGVGDDFKKNERVKFSVLSETTTSNSTTVTTNTFNGNTETTQSVDTETNQYNPGDNAEIFVVVESARKELELMSEKEATYTQNGETDTRLETTSLKLSEKE